jgi:hypothetical protein
MNNGKLLTIFPELSSQLLFSRMPEGITNFVIHSPTQKVRYASVTAGERKRQREMNGKLREELPVKSSNFNDKLPTNTRKVQETATNIVHHVPPPLFRVMASSYRTTRSHSDTAHSAGLLRTNDQSDAQTI